MSVVEIMKILRRDWKRKESELGKVFEGNINVDEERMGELGEMDREEGLKLIENEVERKGIVEEWGDGVEMNGIERKEESEKIEIEREDELRKVIEKIVVEKKRDKSKEERLVIRIEKVNEENEIIRMKGREEIEEERVFDEEEILDMRMVRMESKIEDKDNVEGSEVKVEGSRIDEGKGLLIEKKKGLMDGVEVCIEKGVVDLGGDEDRENEINGLGNEMRKGWIELRMRDIEEKEKNKMVKILKIGVKEMWEREKKVKSRRRMKIGNVMEMRIRNERGLVEIDKVDDIEKVGWKIEKVISLNVRWKRIGEMKGNKKEIKKRIGWEEGEKDGNLKEEEEEVENIIREMLRKDLGEIKEMKKKWIEERKGWKMLIEIERIEWKKERRIGKKKGIKVVKRLWVRIKRKMYDRIDYKGLRGKVISNLRKCMSYKIDLYRII